jgi:hypothetical protein
MVAGEYPTGDETSTLSTSAPCHPRSGASCVHWPAVTFSKAPSICWPSVRPGVGKSHAACALGLALVEGGHAVLFRPAYQPVQELLAAKRDLTLPRLLRRLDAAELLMTRQAER